MCAGSGVRRECATARNLQRPRSMSASRPEVRVVFVVGGTVSSFPPAPGTDPLLAGLVSVLIEVLREVVESVQQLEPPEGGVPGHGGARCLLLQPSLQLVAHAVSSGTRLGVRVEGRGAGRSWRVAVCRHAERLRVGGQDTSLSHLRGLFRQLGHAQRLPDFAPTPTAYVNVQRIREAVRKVFIEK